MNGKIYRRLHRLNRAFDVILRQLSKVRKDHVFDASELRRLRDRSEETRASMNSYLTSALETSETDRAGKLYRRRKTKEAAED